MPAIADDLFAGAGGWDLAAEALGVTARGIENDPAARATREAAGLSTIHDDVWTYQPDGLAQGLIASPPCQTFSKAGKGSGRKALTDVAQALATDAYADKGDLRALAEAVGDERTALVLLPMHYATQHGHYRWLAWEQVPTVLPVWEACAAILRELGWLVWAGLLHAEQHAVPQTRTRAVLLAVQDGEALPPLPTHSRYYPRSPTKLDEGVARWVTMAEALAWGMTRRPYPTVAPGIGQGGPDPLAVGGAGGRAVVHNARAAGDWLEQPPVHFRINNQPRATRRAIDQPAPTIATGHAAATEMAWHADRPEWVPTFVNQGDDPQSEQWPYRRPATTIVGSFRPEIVAAPGYRTTVSRQNAPGSVRVTVAEAGVLQGFPADFPWQGSRSAQFRQVGNAIPPPLAAAVLAQAVGAGWADGDTATTTDDEGAA